MIVIGQGVIDWVSARALVIFGPACRGIGLERDGKIIAGVVYENWNKRNVFVHQAIEGRLTRQYLWTICDYPFNQLKVERVTGMIPQGNPKAATAAEKIGFKLETVLKDAHPSGDILIYVLRRNTCRWLNENLHKIRMAMAA